MKSPLQHLSSIGTKLWVDSVDLDLVAADARRGATGATSNPVIIESLVKAGHGKDVLAAALRSGLDDESIAWKLTDHLVSEVERHFLPVFERTRGDDGYVSFELDPLIEDPALALPHDERVRRYVELGLRWSRGHPNRMIKVPATPAGIAALTPLAAAGVPLNVTLLFTRRQYVAARNAVVTGLQQRGASLPYKSVYSIFVSRLDVYAEASVPDLSRAAAHTVGILNAKRIWADNQAFWPDLRLPLQQEIVFASTGVKDPALPAWRYVEALAGSDIQTNPPATNAALEASGVLVSRNIDTLPAANLIAEIDAKVDMARLEAALMTDGIHKFVSPQRALLAAIAARRAQA
jgi:transaldolase